MAPAATGRLAVFMASLGYWWWLWYSRQCVMQASLFRGVSIAAATARGGAIRELTFRHRAGLLATVDRVQGFAAKKKKSDKDASGAGVAEEVSGASGGTARRHRASQTVLHS